MTSCEAPQAPETAPVGSPGQLRYGTDPQADAAGGCRAETPQLYSQATAGTPTPPRHERPHRVLDRDLPGTRSVAAQTRACNDVAPAMFGCHDPAFGEQCADTDGLARERHLTLVEQTVLRRALRRSVRIIAPATARPLLNAVHGIDAAGRPTLHLSFGGWAIETPATARALPARALAPRRPIGGLHCGPF